MKTKVYLQTPRHLSQAMHRVEREMTRSAPAGVEVVHSQQAADVVVLHVIGYDDTVKAIEALKPSQRYIMMQYCVRSTQQPDTKFWAPLWRGAQLVWSYYDLAALYAEDEGEGAEWNMYDAPLGADPTVFILPRSDERRFTAFTSGYVAASESIQETADAVAAVGGAQYHLGPRVALGGHVTYGQGLSDSMLAAVYQKCKFVTGLRRCEGFELPVVEGLFCGVRPICYDAPHYRRWYDEWAEFIPEADPAAVTKSLIEVFERGARPVTQLERNEAASKFNWQRVMTGFWRQFNA